MRRTSARVRSRSSRSSRSGSVSQPISALPYTSGISRSSYGRAGGRSSRGSSELEQDQPRHRHPLGRLERQQAAHPVPDDHDPGPESLERRDDILRVGVERERRGIGRLRPVVVAQVERVALPAARREVAEVALPEPRAGELAVDEQQWLAARAPLGQPRLDVDAPLVQLDLVLADGTAVGWR